MRKRFSIKNSAAEPRRTWLEVVWNEKATEPATIRIDGQIGKSWFDDSGISSQQFNKALDEIPEGTPIHLRINSEGGTVQDGLGIYNAIKERAADVTAYVDGYALSAASFLPLAAGKIVSPKSAIWMIHSASLLAYGNEQEHLKAADMLKKHDETLIGIYADRTGKSKTEIRAAMQAETWFTGDEATAWGLADETPEEDAAMALGALDVSAFKNIPPNILSKISPACRGERQSEAVASAQPVPSLMNKQAILALLKKHGVEIAADATDEQILTAIGTLGDKNKTTPATIPDAALTAIGTLGDKNKTTPATIPDAALKLQLDTITAQLSEEKRRRISASVQTFIDECRVPAEQKDEWIQDAMKDEKVLARLAKMPAHKPGGEPIGGRVEPGAENRFDEIKNEKNKAKRHAMARAEWNQLYAEAGRRDKRNGASVMNTNTYSATLVTSFLLDGAVTDLQNVWAMLKAFSLDFSPDPYKPLAVGQLKHVTAGPTSQTNATNFESGNATVAPVSITTAQYSTGFSVSNSDLNSGLRLENLMTISTAKFANTVIEAATAPITVANFGAATVTSTPDAFSFSQMATLQAALKKSPVKNLILDGSYIARIANTPAFFQTAGVIGGDTGAWRAFGWNLIAQNTDWAGADANTVGFACHPQAIAGIVGLPLTPPNIPGGILQENTEIVPGLDIAIALYSWYNPATRTMWNSFDVVAGFAAADKTAGFIVASA
jgi:ATP-dependent protease ClpP protease subunit